jgi:hypothetical protein
MDVDVCIGVLSGRFSFDMSNTFGNKHCIEIRHGCEVSGSANKFDTKKKYKNNGFKIDQIHK